MEKSTTFKRMLEIRNEADYYKHKLFETLQQFIPRLEQYNSIKSESFRERRRWVRGDISLDDSGMEISYFYSWGDPVPGNKFRLPYWFINMDDDEFEASMDNLIRLENEKLSKVEVERMQKEEEEARKQYEKLKERFENGNA